MPKVASATKTVTLGQDVVIIGEAINPTTNPELKADLRAGRTTVVKRLAIEQKRQGADILDVNVGLPDIDEKAMFLKAVKAISQVVDLPLQLDSTKPDVIGTVLSEYTGVPIINSVSGK
ncbi:MAG: dihydropteroate synthase, partial [Eubacteriaceae bacterium]|nr:dihydropteroate synthase [Eubacteriaceae bacterium]